MLSTDIQGRSQPSCMALCNGVVNHGAQIGVFRFFLQTTHAKTNAKTNASTIFAGCAAFYWSLSSRSVYHSTFRWHTHLTSHNYFDYGKTWRTPIWAPCWDKNGVGSGISVVYLWCYLKFINTCFTKHPFTKFSKFFKLPEKLKMALNL